jgi:hypothetical protein
VAVSETDAQLVNFRVAARGLAKRLRKRSEAGDLHCEKCGQPLKFDEAVAVLMQCGHEVLAVPCEEHGYASFETPGSHGHDPREGLPMPLSQWLKL